MNIFICKIIMCFNMYHAIIISQSLISIKDLQKGIKNQLSVSRKFDEVLMVVMLVVRIRCWLITIQYLVR